MFPRGLNGSWARSELSDVYFKHAPFQLFSFLNQGLFSASLDTSIIKPLHGPHLLQNTTEHKGASSSLIMAEELLLFHLFFPVLKNEEISRTQAQHLRTEDFCPIAITNKPAGRDGVLAGGGDCSKEEKKRNISITNSKQELETWWSLMKIVKLEKSKNWDYREEWVVIIMQLWNIFIFGVSTGKREIRTFQCSFKWPEHHTTLRLCLLPGFHCKQDLVLRDYLIRLAPSPFLLHTRLSVSLDNSYEIACKKIKH